MVVCARAALKNFKKVNAQGLVLSELQWAVETFCFSGGRVGREFSAIPNLATAKKYNPDFRILLAGDYFNLATPFCERCSCGRIRPFTD